MRVLVLGAGVLGTFYAYRLASAGEDVTVLARGDRAEEIRSRGLVVAEPGRRAGSIPVTVIESLEPDDAYDLVIVLVRNEQVRSVLPALSASRRTPNVLFMVNNPSGPGALVEALGAERVLIGFPGAGGERSDGVVSARVVLPVIQVTTLGELDGSRSARVLAIAEVLRAAGFPTAISPDMDAWLKTHVALVSPIANALYGAGGDMRRLARTRDLLVLMVRAIREGLAMLDALGIPPRPARMAALRFVPEPLLVSACRLALRTDYAELIVARHANTARGEMRVLADEFAALARSSGVATPSIDHLRVHAAPQAPLVPDGSSGIPLRLGGVVALGLGLAALAVLSRATRRVRH